EAGLVALVPRRVLRLLPRVEAPRLGAARRAGNVAAAARGVLPRAARLRRALRPRRRLVAAGARVLREDRGAVSLPQHRSAGRPAAGGLRAVPLAGPDGRGGGPRAATGAGTGANRPGLQGRG